jgi:hypothetical protein
MIPPGGYQESGIRNQKKSSGWSARIPDPIPDYGLCVAARGRQVRAAI